MFSFASVPFSPPEDEEVQQRKPRYPGEDTTPTRRKEILGWYIYGVAAEVFAVSGVDGLTSIEMDASHLPCVGSPSSAGNGTESAMVQRNGTETADEQCVVPVFGLQISTASFAMYTFSLAVLVQALTLISFSALADYGNNRKALLISFGIIGSITSMLFIFVPPSLFVVGSILVVIGITCLGSSFVFLNSFLPVLVANDTSIQSSKDEQSHELPELNTDSESTDFRSSDVDGIEGDYGYARHASASVEPGPTAKPPTSSPSPELQLSTQISSKGVGFGYCAAIFVQILSICLLLILSKTSLPKKSASIPLRCVLLLVGIWWFSFTMLARRWLRNRPGPPLESSTPGHKSRWKIWLSLVAFAWKSLWKTVKVAVRLREVIIFLVAWFLISDAMATVSSTAILFARTELHLSTTMVGLLSITAISSGMLGAFLWPVVSRRFRLKSTHTIILCVVLFELIPLYGMLAYIPLFKKWGVIGLQQPWEIYPLAIVHGAVSGGLASYCRSCFGLLIPPGSEAAFYALYAATDKGSSFIGPALVGMLVDATGQVRSGFFVVAVLIALPIPLVWMVNVEKGRVDGVAMAEAIETSKLSGATPDLSADDTEEAERLLARE
ncbi:Autophagy protein 22 [Monascus purpureus]|uniref:Autophagy-related protein n=1 Tax=Monascus purpureus TaxID=5098 RepID=A0A507QSB4_MONPU|nr:Autophagy protein 22 [Monascus purpureus]